MYHKILTAAALVLVSALSVSTAPAWAAPDASKAAALDVASTSNPTPVLAQATAPEIGYYDMTPDFTTNLASIGRGRLHYVRIHVNIMVKDNADLPLVTAQDPLIRDAILSIIGTKEYNAIATAAGREALALPDARAEGVRVELGDEIDLVGGADAAELAALGIALAAAGPGDADGRLRDAFFSG